VNYVSLFENLRHHRKDKLTTEPGVYDRLRAMRDKMTVH
jgi:hypothetical protein